LAKFAFGEPQARKRTVYGGGFEREKRFRLWDPSHTRHADSALSPAAHPPAHTYTHSVTFRIFDLLRRRYAFSAQSETKSEGGAAGARVK